ncbi:MAG: DUF1844 domain-containing protein [Acidobacteria bacterium]|nr:DUF1844 domain-containing protein [Acidobacteriota bacterium]
MEERGEDRDRRIQVDDRRAFDSRGNRRRAEAGPEKVSDAPEPEGPATEPGPEAPESVGFDFFVQSLYLQALMQLGDLEDPVTRNRSANLDAARLSIDFLGILQNKTLGNLDADETRYLEEVLFDLRMRYARKATSP